jgi:hypothetical protein
MTPAVHALALGAVLGAAAGYLFRVAVEAVSRRRYERRSRRRAADWPDMRRVGLTDAEAARIRWLRHGGGR